MTALLSKMTSSSLQRPPHQDILSCHEESDNRQKDGRFDPSKLAQRHAPATRQYAERQDQEAQHRPLKRNGQRFDVVPMQDHRSDEEQSETDDQNNHGSPKPLSKQRPRFTRKLAHGPTEHVLARHEAVAAGRDLGVAAWQLTVVGRRRGVRHEMHGPPACAAWGQYHYITHVSVWAERAPAAARRAGRTSQRERPGLASSAFLRCQSDLAPLRRSGRRGVKVVVRRLRRGGHGSFAP